MRKILNLKSLAAATAGVVALAACGSDDPSSGGDAADSADPVSIVATTSVHADIVLGALGGELPAGVTLDVVIPAGGDPHDFQPSAKQAELMEEADLLVVNGLGLEAGLDGIIDAVEDSGTRIFTFADHVTVRSDEEHEDEEHEGEEHEDEEHEDEEHEDGHGDGDPHLWMDPVAVARAVVAFGGELAAIGLDGAAVADSVDAYVAALDALDGDITSRLADVPGDRRVLVTNHDSLGYFADRYDLEVVGAVIPSLTTSADVAPSQLDDLAGVIAERGVRAIFAETTESDRLATALADQVGGGVQVVELFTGSLGPAGSGAETYLEMLATNADRIAEALTA